MIAANVGQDVALLVHSGIAWLALAAGPVMLAASLRVERRRSDGGDPGHSLGVAAFVSGPLGLICLAVIAAAGGGLFLPALGAAAFGAACAVGAGLVPEGPERRKRRLEDPHLSELWRRMAARRRELAPGRLARLPVIGRLARTVQRVVDERTRMVRPALRAAADMPLIVEHVQFTAQGVRCGIYEFDPQQPAMTDEDEYMWGRGHVTPRVVDVVDVDDASEVMARLRVVAGELQTEALVTRGADPLRLGSAWALKVAGYDNVPATISAASAAAHEADAADHQAEALRVVEALRADP